MMINVQICTYNARIEKVSNVLQPRKDNVRYTISHQCTDIIENRIPDELLRDDVSITKNFGSGLSRNRNHALSLAEGEIVIIADDDVQHTEDAFEIVENIFSSDPDLDVACFKIKTPEGMPPYKRYPMDSYYLNQERKHYISSIEIAFRLKPLKEKNIRFDPLFGLGTDYFVAGEEEALIRDCISHGLTVKYFPIEIVMHPYESSSKGISPFDRKRVRIMAGLDARKSVSKAVILTINRSIQLLPAMLKNKKNPLVFLYQSLMAIRYITQHRRKK